MPLYNITTTIERARGLIARGDHNSLLYAALELRFCYESIAYLNLATYGEQVSTALAREWRPDQIMRMLAEFDPLSQDSIEFAISAMPPELDSTVRHGDLQAISDSVDFTPIGTARRIPWKKFRRQYNALGSFLHVGKDGKNVYPTPENLKSFITALEEVASSTVIAAAKDIATGQCECGATLILGPAEQSGDKEIFCPNTRCNRTYMAIKGDPEHRISLVKKVRLLCECGAKVPFTPEGLLKPKICPSCKATVRALIVSKTITLSALCTETDERTPPKGSAPSPQCLGGGKRGPMN